jgi:hypothetical protein
VTEVAAAVGLAIEVAAAVGSVTEVDVAVGLAIEVDAVAGLVTEAVVVVRATGDVVARQEVAADFLTEIIVKTAVLGTSGVTGRPMDSAAGRAALNDHASMTMVRVKNKLRLNRTAPRPLL